MVLLVQSTAGLRAYCWFLREENVIGRKALQSIHWHRLLTIQSRRPPKEVWENKAKRKDHRNVLGCIFSHVLLRIGAKEGRWLTASVKFSLLSVEMLLRSDSCLPPCVDASFMELKIKCSVSWTLSGIPPIFLRFCTGCEYCNWLPGMQPEYSTVHYFE